MKFGGGLVAVLLLAACAGGGGGGVDGAPLQITTFAPSISSEGDVDLALAFSNTSGRDFKYVELRLAAYDVAGRRVAGGGLDKNVTLSGPYLAGKGSGPIALKGVWVASDIRCLEVSQAKVTFLDYSTQILSGPSANQLVANDSRRVCHADGG
ncbi:hypothetical protein [Pseudomonas sp. NPDC007930]|uniref:hypothetical protein n=1 Tax=Pseudomonas sp. NPDC007930 TaxID=3364417 RepID=UPI0036E2432B